MPASAPPGTPTPLASGDVFERLTQFGRLLTAQELGKLLAVSPKTLYSYVSRRLIPYVKIETSVRFNGKDIAEWLRQRAA